MNMATRKKPTKKRSRKANPWDKAFGQRLQNARGSLSQQEMADYLELQLNTYQKYEKGARTFPKDLIAKVVRKTGHGPWLLLTGEPDHLCPANQGGVPPPHPTESQGTGAN